ncbi:armadillo-type protein [Phlyctochytrium arcticum]|nr:armadillo-type protein [Phlyctochytrium arcticum]
MQSTNEQQQAKVIPVTQVVKWFSALTSRSNPDRQKDGALQIVTFIRPPASHPLFEASYELEKADILKITLLLRPGASEGLVLEAILLLLTCMIRKGDVKSSIRVEALLSSGAYQRVLAIAADQRMALQARIAAMRFVREYLDQGDIKAVQKFSDEIVHETENLTGTGVAIRCLSTEITDDPGLPFWSAECLWFVGNSNDFRQYILDTDVIPPLAAYMKHVCSSGFCASLIGEHTPYKVLLYRGITRLLQCLTSQSDDTKIALIHAGAVVNLKWMITRESTEEELVEAIKTFASVVIGNAAETLDCLRLLLVFLKEGGDSRLTDAILRACRNAMTGGDDSVRKCFLTENGIELLRPHFMSDIWDRVLDCAAILQNVCLLELPETARAKTLLCFPRMLEILQISKTVDDADIPLWSNIVHNILCAICNMSVTDAIAQDISIAGRSTLFGNIYRTIFDRRASHSSLRLVALACLRNLCIDDDACLLITSMGIPKLFELLFDESPAIRAESLTVLRNLILQNRYCFDTFFDTDNFTEEVIADLSSTDSDILQRCAIDIVHCYVSKGDMTHQRVLFEQDCLPALLISIEVGNDSGRLAAAAFKILQAYEARTVLNCKDHWSRIWGEWKAQDKERNRALELKNETAREARDRKLMQRKRVKKGPTRARTPATSVQKAKVTRDEPVAAGIKHRFEKMPLSARASVVTANSRQGILKKAEPVSLAENRKADDSASSRAVSFE